MDYNDFVGILQVVYNIQLLNVEEEEIFSILQKGNGLKVHLMITGLEGNSFDL